MASADEVKAEIIAVMRDLDPQSQTHSQMAVRLEGFATAHQVAMNMNAMAANGRLELIRDGSERHSHTKRYRLPGSNLPRLTRRAEPRSAVRGGAINDPRTFGVDQPREPQMAKVEAPEPIEPRILRIDGQEVRVLPAAGAKFTGDELDELVGRDRETVPLPTTGVVVVRRQKQDVSGDFLNEVAMAFWEENFHVPRIIVGNVLVCERAMVE